MPARPALWSTASTRRAAGATYDLVRAVCDSEKFVRLVGPGVDGRDSRRERPPECPTANPKG